jgi:hypothetical protein
MACEWALASVPIATGLGLMRHNKSAVETLANPAFMVTLALWMSGCFKAACRQVRRLAAACKNRQVVMSQLVTK